MDYKQRIMKEISNLQNNKLENIIINIGDTINIIHFILIGYKDTVFENGYYYCKLFLNKYPVTAPDIMMITPNGLFKPNTKLCIDGLTSHHNETWAITTKLDKILIAFQSFMNDTIEEEFIGKIHTTITEKKILSKSSIKNNLENTEFVKTFKDTDIYRKMIETYNKF
ncbi:ubiquitin-conjugating enzyme E2 [Alphaentomopoxvirus acuprea]|uniref:Ubiquitin-conjugating enzyme E2 n=1 Tax=Alphaentomopoxvirus acuprea TaxID=62099 RepID=W6JLK9_9POXV|nr:ubiquitin-conjugating enzyme E2 [Anomala cuprea entomopoxvirus]BAO49521.1 ubiquitin-conjugating enzyme E2 [Anomala cuprea entomopoxvirus]